MSSVSPSLSQATRDEKLHEINTLHHEFRHYRDTELRARERLNACRRATHTLREARRKRIIEEQTTWLTTQEVPVWQNERDWLLHTSQLRPLTPAEKRLLRRLHGSFAFLTRLAERIVPVQAHQMIRTTQEVRDQAQEERLAQLASLNLIRTELEWDLSHEALTPEEWACHWEMLKARHDGRRCQSRMTALSEEVNRGAGPGSITDEELDKAILGKHYPPFFLE